MKIHLIETDRDLRAALSQQLMNRGVIVEEVAQDAERVAARAHCDGDLVVVGHHTAASELAALASAIWPTPLAALLPVFDTSHIVGAVKAGAVDVFDRSAASDVVAEWIVQCCSTQQTTAANHSLAGTFFSNT